MTRRRTLITSGVGLVAAGVALLGYVAWQYVGTTVVADRAQARTVERLEQQWGPSTSPVEALGPDDPVPGDAIAVVRVPRFGADYAVPVVEGVDPDALASGLGHFDGSAAPGAAGNFALAGHRVTQGEPLRDIDELRPGDEVIVETAHAVLTYRVDTDPDDLEVDDTQGWVVDPRPDNPVAGGVQPAGAARLLTLVTCAELFHTDERTVVFGHLVATAPR
ncbi:class E sortase [Nocardioides mangrovi]|uniref:Class E sortase n=1 Tax=Nocardioides mangrovi TaxID=2874580 RepID=A0ABS7UC75_9ACTN|nr:class E sortase [Nocardioides mangrovi]MBZ5738268.1 class E sortase [Nocardioides mangrovi]